MARSELFAPTMYLNDIFAVTVTACLKIVDFLSVKSFCPILEKLLWALMINFLLFIVVWIGWVRSKDLLAAAG